MKRIIEAVIRFRTWVFNILMAVWILIPELLNTPEFVAVVPEKYKGLIVLAVALVNIWMRPRPAVLPYDLEASVSRSKRK